VPVTQADVQTWAKQLNALVADGERPHGSNLLHQVKRNVAIADPRVLVLGRVIPPYLKLCQRVKALPHRPSSAQIATVVAELDCYLGLLEKKENDIFKRQADLKTSVIPEFLVHVFERLVVGSPVPVRVVGQSELIIDVTFDPRVPGYIVPKTQRVDIAVVVPVEFSIGGANVDGFGVPLVAAEVKRHFDKNMFAGTEHSVAALKRTFPRCAYFAMGEWSDFDIEGQNYANSGIDEILVLRNQKRSAYRRSRVAGPLDATQFGDIAAALVSRMDALAKVKPGLKARMANGLLIAGAVS
jgi:hypothetical protein